MIFSLVGAHTFPLITLYRVSVPLDEMGGLFSLPAYVVLFFLAWLFSVFSSGLFSSFWRVLFSVYGVMAGASSSSFVRNDGSVGNGTRVLLVFSAYKVMAFPAIQEFALSSVVMAGKRDCGGSCAGLGLSGVLSRLWLSGYWVMAYGEIVPAVAWKDEVGGR